MEFYSFQNLGITDLVFVGVVLLVRETGGTSVYDFGRDLRDFPFGWDLFCAVSMYILTTPVFLSVVCCVIDIAVPWIESRLEVEEGLVSIVGSLRDREVACSASDRQGSNFESCVWRTVSSQSSHHPQEVLLAQFSLYVHKGGLKPDSFHFIS